MKLSCLRMSLLLLGYIVCLGEITSLNNRLMDAYTLKSFSNVDVKKQLKIINKHVTKIIKTTYGDTYECVDFYKQPAFDHPLMKNHLSHYKRRRTSSLTNSEANNGKFGFLWKDGVGYYVGTVPIKKLTKDKLLRSFSDIYEPQGSWNFTNNRYYVGNDQHHFAVSRTKRGKGKGKIYNGATMALTTNNPKVKRPQFSSARMHVQIGDDFIQTGWTVHPSLYPDSKTRHFVYTKAGKNQCYNDLCPAGITFVRPDFPPGLVRDPPNIRGSTTVYSDRFGLHKDQTNGKWWLTFSGEQIGFWEGNIFQQSSANNVEWGGEVYSASMAGPQMGYGYIPLENPFYDACIFNITIVDDKFKTDEVVKHTETFSDYPQSYKVFDDIYSKFSPLNAKHIIYFGGPGLSKRE